MEQASCLFQLKILFWLWDEAKLPRLCDWPTATLRESRKASALMRLAYGHATRTLISQLNPNWRSPLTPQNSGGNTYHLYRTTSSLLPAPCSLQKNL
ncbi:hypothetical protein [Moorena sp. SIO3H5]|uniref:hypothetical protein n=1 Tax=Moorena sp. SIO3H5 TaxID=2607834 RepID=UPI0013BDF3C7|nr:hypothetical protein [Moorena sp. SIO3H5]NEO69323.1 hypothetical protein [Moorena sp. SIO3H5]